MGNINSRAKNFFKHPLFWIGATLVFLTFLDFFTQYSITKAIALFFNHELIDSEKEHFYLFLHLFFVITIFVFQEIQAGKTNSDLQNLMRDYAPIKLENTTKSAEQIKDWIKNDPHPNVYVFYFPYSIIPGFWIDAGYDFDTFLIPELTRLKENAKDKFVFIGSNTVATSPFALVLDSLNGKDETDFFKCVKERDEFTGNCNLTSDITNKAIAVQKIKERYNRQQEQLTQIKTDKSNHVHLIESDNCNNFTSNSFVMKITKNKIDEMFLYDTFKIFDNTKLSEFLPELGIKSICKTKKNNPEILFKVPNPYLIKNPKTNEIFFTLFLECGFGEDIKLKSFLNSLN